MANNKSKFQLNKGGDHNFDISKGRKRKFDLTKDEEETVVAQVKTNIPNPKPIEDTKEVTVDNGIDSTANSGKKWMWIILAVAVIAVLAWLLIPTCNNSKENAPIIEAEEVTSVDTVGTVEVEEAAEAAKSIDEAESIANDNTAMSVDSSPEVSATQPVVSVASIPNSEKSMDDLEQEALKVIRGEYGSGQVRKEKLGSNYQAIQNRVNELKREGVF